MLKYIELVVKIKHPPPKKDSRSRRLNDFTGKFPLTFKDNTIQIALTISENGKKKESRSTHFMRLV